MSILSQELVRYFTNVVISEGEGLDLRTQITIMESHEELRAENKQLRRANKELGDTYDPSGSRATEQLARLGAENRRLHEELERAAKALGETYQAVLTNEEKNVILDSLSAAYEAD